MEHDEISALLKAVYHLSADGENATSDPMQSAARFVALESNPLPSMMLAWDRSRSGQAAANAQSLWPALLAGQWSVLEGFATGQTRYIVACKNKDNDVVRRALRPREQRVLELSLDGFAGKWIAYDLGLSPSTVSRTLRTALCRIGVVDIGALAGIRTALFEPLDGLPPGFALVVARLGPSVSTQLSPAECAIVAGILRGKRIATIARERLTSRRTVTNQLASIYQKLGVSSRLGLIAALS